MPIDHEWEAHRRELEAVKEDRKNLKYKWGTRGKLSPRIRRLQNYTSIELLAELGRRRRKVLKDNAPELLAEREAKGKAVRAIRMKYCDHTKFAPKLRVRGKHAGKWCCPSCCAEVPAPTP